jgi:3-methyladenine DNA glycosylase/8-oxoguanine DNA glycosylase
VNRQRTCCRPIIRRAFTCHQRPYADQLKAAADQAIAACGGDAREAVKALIVANHFLETELEKLRAAVSMGYARGRLAEEAITLPRDRKDWYD